MWTKNSFQQMSFDDTVTNMPNYLKDFLKDSWAHIFQKIIFPAINEDRFAVLYSKNPSRPNSPVNVIIGALILKEVFGLSDVELLGSIYFDDRFQYALRLTNFDNRRFLSIPLLILELEFMLMKKKRVLI